MIKTSINSVYPNLSPPRASRLPDLTVLQQYVYHVTLRNVYEFEKRLSKVWISLEHNIIDTAVDTAACDCTIGQHFNQFYCRQLKNETIGQSVSHSVKNVKKCVFVRYLH